MNLEKRLAALEARLKPNQNLVWLAAFCNASRANPAAVEKLRALCQNYRGSGRLNELGEGLLAHLDEHGDEELEESNGPLPDEEAQ
jgi:hypothetical protein